MLNVRIVRRATELFLGVFVAWEFVARVWLRSKRKGGPTAADATDSEGHYAPELEHRRRLDLRPSRWPGPARW
jgi:hypothetical protein